MEPTLYVSNARFTIAPLETDDPTLKGLLEVRDMSGMVVARLTVEQAADAYTEVPE